MIIGITGYGATGASAYIDLIKEYEDIQSYRASFEFQLLQQPDGLLDLKYDLVNSGRRLSTNASIKRFLKNVNNPRSYYITKETRGEYKLLTRKYIENIVQIEWNGKSNYDPSDLRKFYDIMLLRNVNKVIHKIINSINNNWIWPPKKNRYFSFLTEQEFNNATKKYLCDILRASNFDLTKPILLEQLFNTRNPLEGAEFFEGDIKSIIVDRDPRDVYYLTNYHLKKLCNFMPNTGDVKQFVEYYRALHTNRVNDDRILYVKYEDLIYCYEDTIEIIEEFLGGLKQVNRGLNFRPECSINNTMLYKQHPELRSEFDYIEQELGDLLYPFEERVNQISFTPKMMKPFDRQSEVKK